MAQWELRNIDNVLSMFRRKRLTEKLYCLHKKKLLLGVPP
jgi:hypothetical protein